MKNLVIPLKRDGRTLTIAMADPTNLGVLEDLKFITRYDIFPVIAGEFTLRNVIEKIYGSQDEQRLQTLMNEIADDADVEVIEEHDDDATQADIDDAPVVKLINAILTDAVPARQRGNRMAHQQQKIVNHHQHDRRRECEQ